jgi:hypothetical protein
MTGSDFANWIELILVRIYMYTLLWLLICLNMKESLEQMKNYLQITKSQFRTGFHPKTSRWNKVLGRTLLTLSVLLSKDLIMVIVSVMYR